MLNNSRMQIPRATGKSVAHSMALTKEQIVQGLRSLGVVEGMVVMAHISLSAFGEVEGGADTLIAALADAVGAAGTLCMPATAADRPFNVATSPSTVGAVTERFRSWPGVVRSIHPTHSVCCLGPMAHELINGHVSQPTALGPQSPWGRLARLPNGYVLLLGCDQDRNTLLHSAEDEVDAPYLNPVERDYLDEDGERHTKVLEKFPGPHRDFIGLDPVFREAGAMKTGQVGKAVCRLMHAGKSSRLTVAALQRDPAAVLCDNPNCDDCVRQRADITRHVLAGEQFALAAVVDEMGLPLDDLGSAIGIIRNQGIDTVEFGPDLTAGLLNLPGSLLTATAALIVDMGARVSLLSCAAGRRLGDVVRRTADVAHALDASMVKLPVLEGGTPRTRDEVVSLAAELAYTGLTLVVENAANTLVGSRQACEQLLVAAPDLRLAFNPAHFAHAGEKPFIQTFYKGTIKHAMAQLYITDGCHRPGEAYTLPGRGHGQVKELMSILRCRSFGGVFCIKLGDRTGKDEFTRTCHAFWHLMDTL